MVNKEYIQKQQSIQIKPRPIVIPTVELLVLSKTFHGSDESKEYLLNQKIKSNQIEFTFRDKQIPIQIEIKYDGNFFYSKQYRLEEYTYPLMVLTTKEKRTDLPLEIYELVQKLQHNKNIIKRFMERRDEIKKKVCLKPMKLRVDGWFKSYHKRLFEFEYQMERNIRIFSFLEQDGLLKYFCY